MLFKTVAKIAIVGILTALYSCQTQLATTEIDSQESGENTAKIDKNAARYQTIVLADITEHPARKIRKYQPTADYLAANLEKFKIKQGRVKIAQDFNTMAEWLKNGEVDLYFDSVYPAMIIGEQSGAYPILRRWKKGQGEYYTVLIGMKDRIRSLNDLKGEIIAFDDRRSTSGYMLPAAYLIEDGFDLVYKRSATNRVDANQIGYVFSDDDENSIQWLIGGKVAAAAVDNQTFSEIPAEIRQAMVVLAKTEPLPRQVVLVSPTMPPEQVKQVKQILLNMDQDPQAQSILEQFEQTKKFDQLPTEISFERMQEIYQLVQQQ